MTHHNSQDLSRRGFIKGALAAGAALYVGFNPSGLLAAHHSETALNPFVKISEDGTVTVIIKHFEMGQGTTTGLTTLVAEELDADWSQVVPDFAPANQELYANLFFGGQGTGGSTAIANSFEQYRKAGAAAREVLVRAASLRWGVEESAITVEKGVVKSGNWKAGFGDLIKEASKVQPNAEPTLKDPKDFTLIGKMNLHRKDSIEKTDGTATFALDVNLPGQVYVAVKRSPKFGGKLTSFDASSAKEAQGYIDAKALPNGKGVAVYAENTWAAFQARDAVEAEWDFTNAENRSTDKLLEDHRAVIDNPTYNLRKDVTREMAVQAIGEAASEFEAEFTFPLLAHAPMETLNCVIEPTENGVRVHDGCQFPAITHPTVAGILGLELDQVEIKTVYAGGSFGRRATPDSDYQAEAAMAYDLMGRKTPVKLVWSREDDITGGYYRPMAMHRAKIGIKDGKVHGWDHRIAVKSILKGGPFESALVHDDIDEVSVEGVKDTHYAIPMMAAGLTDFQTNLPVLWWRAVGHTHTAYAMESLMDMAAHAAKADPVDFRLSMLPGDTPDQQRMAGVLKLAAEKAGWGKDLGAGKGMGVAVHKSFNSYVALVAEVTANGDEVHVDKITCAVDCGIVINPDMVTAQMEGGIAYGLSAVLRDEITLTEGEVDQSNFPDYEPLRMSDMPDIAVHIVPSAVNPTGVGEPGTPPAGPAVANAIFAATGKRLTTLPFTKEGLEFV